MTKSPVRNLLSLLNVSVLTMMLGKELGLAAAD
jgi:hypothetical protein